MRLIDADALVEFWSADFTEEEIHKLHIPLAVAIENIKDAPTIKDAQEAYRNGYKRGRKKGIQVGLRSANKKIVRCRDCRHWHEDVANNFTSIPRGGCKLVRGLTNGDFYCALGERKEQHESS